MKALLPTAETLTALKEELRCAVSGEAREPLTLFASSSILEAIEWLPVGAGNEVTDRRLRPIARLPHDEQLTAVAERLDVGIKANYG